MQAWPNSKIEWPHNSATFGIAHSPEKLSMELCRHASRYVSPWPCAIISKDPWLKWSRLWGQSARWQWTWIFMRWSVERVCSEAALDLWSTRGNVNDGCAALIVILVNKLLKWSLDGETPLRETDLWSTVALMSSVTLVHLSCSTIRSAGFFFSLVKPLLTNVYIHSRDIL